MRKFLSLMFITLCAILSHGQQPGDECLIRHQTIDSLIVANNLLLANESWDDLVAKCEARPEKFYKTGETILQYRQEMAPADSKEIAVKNLIALYDEYDAKFPGNTNGNLINKAVALHKHGMSDRAEIYKLLDRAFTNNRAQFSNAEALNLYFDIYYEKFTQGDQGVTGENILARLDDIHMHVGVLSETASPQQQHVYNNLKSSLDAGAKSVLICDNLIPFLTGKFDSRKDDAKWLQRAADNLLANNCTIDPIFAQISERAHALNPTAASAYAMAIVEFRANNKTKAAAFFEQSANLNPRPHEKAAIYYTIASSLYNTSDRAKAKEFALKATNAQPDFGKGFLFLAQLYGSAGEKCGATAFEKKAINWLAAETALKAGLVDPKYKAGAEKMAESYLKKVPTKAEIKNEKMGGRQITYKCWINESVKVPKE